MNLLDALLVVIALAYAVSGYQQGFVVGAGSTAGLLLGGFAGAKLTPPLLDGFAPGVGVAVTALTIVLVAALVGQAFGALLGRHVRSGLTWRPVRVLDALSGSALSVAAVLLIAWVVGVAVTGVVVRPIRQEVRTSAILRTVDRALPGGSDGILSAFNALVDSSRFPSYLEPFASEHIEAVPRPTRRIIGQPRINAARSSVVKILGVAPSCGHDLEGSGFVFASDRVMTNAHVVAGVERPVVHFGNGQFPATVVYYDPEVDVAVLRVPALPAPALRFGRRTAGSKDPAAVLGYPENGPYDIEPARVREIQTLRSPDIYGEGTVERQAYSVYAHVRQGNSGGPLVNRRGAVIGVIFAASVTDARTGYALTAGQVAAAARAGDSSSQRVDTGACAM